MNITYIPEISLGAILQLGGILLTLVIVYTQVIVKLSRMETKVDALWQWFLKNGQP